MIITRAQARRGNFTRYFTGKPCNFGHICYRYTGSAGCVECVTLRGKAARAKNPEKYRRQYKARRDANLEHFRAQVNARNAKRRAVNRARSNAYHAQNPGATTLRSRIRRARKKGAAGYHTKLDIQILYQNQRGYCNNQFCRHILVQGFHVDHITPVSRGGSNWPNNIQLLCQPCNDSKGAKTAVEWHAFQIKQRELSIAWPNLRRVQVKIGVGCYV